MDFNMLLINFIPRLLNKLSSFFFYRYAIRHFKSCGYNVYVGYNWYLAHPENISIGDNFSANINLRLACSPEYRGKSTSYLRTPNTEPELIIGSNVTMISNCQVSCANKIIIGDGCLFGDNVFVTDNFHGSSSSLAELEILPIERKLASKGPVIIGENCWLGRNVCVMPGVTIGKGCVIGANAVVTHDIPDYSVAAGIPANVIRKIE